MLRAVIWDVDGTIAETERDGHRVAFNQAFVAEGLPWTWDVAIYGDLLTTAGGFERLLRFLSRREDAPASPASREALARHLHRVKNRCYAEIVDAGGLGLRPGVQRVVDACRRDGLRLAIATTTSRVNVAAIVRACLASAPDPFDAIVCAEDAPRKKPHPQVYRRALVALGLDASEAVAIEDSPAGLDAANAAGVATLITRSLYFRDARFDRPAAICDDLDSRVRWSAGEAGRVDVEVLRAIVASRARLGAAGPCDARSGSRHRA